LPAKKPGKSVPRAAAAARHRASPQRIEFILNRRGELVAELAQLREREGSSQLIENAQHLLTRWWAAAGWSAREDLLKTAGWLLQVEKRRESIASPL
jgi:hypothetical protein